MILRLYYLIFMKQFRKRANIMEISSIYRDILYYIQRYKKYTIYRRKLLL